MNDEQGFDQLCFACLEFTSSRLKVHNTLK